MDLLFYRKRKFQFAWLCGLFEYYVVYMIIDVVYMDIDVVFCVLCFDVLYLNIHLVYMKSILMAVIGKYKIINF